MFIGDVTLNNLFTYLAGYRTAMDFAGIEDISTPQFNDFHEFVRAKYGYYESTAGWANMILAVTIGLDPNQIRWESYDSEVSQEQHEKSVETFFELIDEFCRENKEEDNENV